MKRRWAINGRFFQQSLTGVQRYGREIVRALDAAIKEGHPFANDLDVEILLPPDATAPEGLERISLRKVGGRSGHAWEQVDLPRAAAGRHLLSLCNAGPLAYRKHIVCIHDLNTRIAPGSYSPQFRMLYRLTIPALGRMALRVATVSHFSAEQLVAFGICKPSKLRVIPNGCEHALGWRPEHTRKTRAVAGKSTILILGSRAPHKNLELLLGMSEELAQRGLRLAVAGSVDPRIFSAGSHESVTGSGAVEWLGSISDGEFAALLDSCLCFAFPSLTEGFGLPPLEAMARGCPVVVSDRASLPEVCGDAALYASPNDPSAWLAQFDRLRASEDLQHQLSDASRARARKFSWRTSADLYLRAMAEVDGSLSPAMQHQE
jgi:glycosyltransferase involved in cell wall biosynthesis